LYWNNKKLRDSFCPTFIHLTAPSLARGFRSKDGGRRNKRRKKNAPYGAIGNLCIFMLCAYGAVDKVIVAF